MPSPSEAPVPAPGPQPTEIGPITQLVYASSAAQAFTGDDLADLLAQAREHNTAADISGLLVFHDGAFLQVLEGPEADVAALYARIGHDPRHTKCRLLLRTAIDEREFGEWSMGFVDPQLAAHGLAGYLDYSTGVAAVIIDTKRAKKVLLQFREGAWR